MKDIIIIGAGVSGCLIARDLARYQLEIAVIEKENDVGNGSSMANSAIVHSGYDPLPGSLKAILNVEGNAMYDELCHDLDVHFGRIGSLTVVTEDSQWLIIKELFERAKKNKVPVKLLNGEEVKLMEKNITPDVKGALYAPSTGIVDPFNLCVHAMENAMDHGVKLFLNERVMSIKTIDGGYEVVTNKATHQAKVVINATGVEADLVSEMLAPNHFSIKPRKGEYFVLDHFGFGFVSHVIFPLPSEKGKGILLTPTTSGNYLVGPSSEYTGERDDLSTDRITLEYVKKMATNLIPNIPFNQVIRTFSGLRASGSTGDFIIEELASHPGFINVAGIESPGLASAPAIAKYVREKLVSKHFSLIEKPNFNPKVRPYVKPKIMAEDERADLVKEKPSFAQVICNCEKVSLGEIEDVLSRSCPPHSVKGVKKRTRAGFGKCQGGFCQPYVIKALAKHYNVPLTKVNYDEEDSFILLEDSKEGN